MAAAPVGAPLIEVVCVAYRRPGPLKVLVRSFLEQTAKNWKLTVWHDGPDAEFERLLRGFAGEDPARIAWRCTPERHNDWGHTLRDLGLRESTGDFILLTNDDNYYVPRTVEFLTRTIRQDVPDVVLFDMVHSYDQPGGVQQPAYNVFETEFAAYRIDIGTAIVRGELARAAGFRDRSQNGDQTYFEDVFRAKGDGLRVAKLHKVLFVHN